MFEITQHYVRTRRGTILVMQRKLTGAWEIIATVIRAILILGGAFLGTVGSGLLPEPTDLYAALMGVGLVGFGLLTMTPWQIVATKIMARRIEWIAGKPPTNAPHTIKLIDDDM